MYWVNPYWKRVMFTPVWSVSLAEALNLIKEAVQGERNDELFYDELIKLAPTPEQASIITSIRDDERGHNQMFRGIYREITGQEITGISNEQYQRVESYTEGLQRALLGELSAVEKYRKIWFGLPVGIYRDTVYGIILDELKHASKYNYLFTLNQHKN
ncbi:ferritin-like domain-containing protein [Paenibacillus monticola]|uniref:Ferritin-like domain-containing protein n=1 Tax=Paenibacillus monticola TaxID=2666075 RepID=A0A7X2H7W8_9BACL|nr:ferritin-like domain-containing protein [Paenibacillus monticola]MRN55184.1 ferritin-like domain-containing protein [Paenibacillus monticola]